MTGPQSETKTASATLQDIIGTGPASRAIAEILNAITPKAPKARLDEIFPRESASQYLDRVTQLSKLWSAEQDFDAAVRSLDAAIEAAEGVRDQVLSELYAQLRPIETSYRLIHLFFENAEVRDTLQRPPVEFHVFNADTQAIGNPTESSTIVALDTFVRSRNDSFNFRQFICNLVIPGYVPDAVRKRLEDISEAWGMLLIGDLKDELTYRGLDDQFRTDGDYEFLKRPENKAASDVITAGWVKLRDRYWFEMNVDEGGADLYAPGSLLFAGCLARTDRTVGLAQGAVGSVFGKIRGIDRARVEAQISQMVQLTMERQVVAVIRNADNDLCFTGSRSQADDPNGVLKFFTSYRILRYLERRIQVYLLAQAEQRLTRNLVTDQIRAPIEQFLDDVKEKGTIYAYELDIEMDPDKWAMGQLDIGLLVTPVGPAEKFNLKIDTPNFRKGEAKQ